MKSIKFSDGAPQIAKKILGVTFMDGQKIEHEGEIFTVRILDQGDMDKELMLLKWLFNRLMYARYFMSGNATFFRVEGPWAEVKKGYRVYGVWLDNYGKVVRMENVRRLGKELMYIVMTGMHPNAYEFREQVVALFCVGPSVLELADTFFRLEDEDEVIRVILSVARVAKSVARLAAPVVIDGEVVDMVPVGYEDLIFNHLLVHELARLRMRGLDRHVSQ